MKKIIKLFKNPRFDLSLLLIITSIIFIISIINLGILGIKYLIPIILGIILIDTLLIVFLNKKIKVKKEKDKVKEKDKKRKRILKIINYVLTILFIIIYSIGSILLFRLDNSMNNLFKSDSYINYSVIVNKSDNYKKINDLNEKIIGFYQEDTYSDKAKKVLNKSVNVDYIGYSSIDELEDALINDEIDGIMIMNSYLELDTNTDNEENNISTETIQKQENFNKNTKKLFTFKIKVDNSNKTKSINLEKGSFVIYVSGQDSYDDEVAETSRSDVNMLMVVNIKTKQILLLTIPRDYYIKINSKGAYDKLTHISLYGSMEAANSLGALLDVDVDYYVKFNFTTFMKAVEYLLPLDVYSDYEFTTSVYDRTIGDCYTFYQGYNHITNSKQALQFVRARKNFAQGDRQRGINQTRFLRAVIKKASSPSVLIKYDKILNSLKGTFLTNIDNDSIINIIKYVLNNNGKWTTNSISLDGSDAHRSTYSGGSQELYVMIPNENTIETAKVAINAVLNGEKPDIETDASELADASNSHEVSKAATNYGSTTSKSSTIKNNTVTASSSSSDDTNKEEATDKDKNDDSEINDNKENKTDDNTNDNDDNKTSDNDTTDDNKTDENTSDSNDNSDNNSSDSGTGSTAPDINELNE